MRNERPEDDALMGHGSVKVERDADIGHVPKHDHIQERYPPRVSHRTNLLASRKRMLPDRRPCHCVRPITQSKLDATLAAERRLRLMTCLARSPLTRPTATLSPRR